MVDGTKKPLVDSETLEERNGEKLKFIFLAAIFFLVIGAYTLIRDLKNSIFIGLVGKEYIPVAKIAFLIVLVPAILFYSKLVDRIKRYYLLGFYSVFYALACLLAAFFIGHPKIGIINTDQSPGRLFGWIFYFLVEGFSPFVLSVFWAYSNSINTPKSAKKNYGFMVSGSQLGGIFTAGLAWALFSMGSLPIIGILSDVAKMRFIFIFASVLLFFVPILVNLLIKHVPESSLHGYEAAHKVDQAVESKKGNNKNFKTGMFSGLKMLFEYPYVLGIFAMTFFYEIVTSILGYLRLGVAEKEGGSIAGISGFFFKWVFIMQSIGLVISFFGTSALLRRLGVKTCVMMIPLMVGVFTLFFILSDNAMIIMIAFTIIKSLNYAFSKPIVESLYIPTLRDIKFKSKSWIDSFGSKFSKSFASVFNLVSVYIPGPLQFGVYMFLFSIILVVWSVTSVLLGRRFEKAIDSNEVIGLEKN